MSVCSVPDFREGLLEAAESEKGLSPYLLQLIPDLLQGENINKDEDSLCKEEKHLTREIKNVLEIEDYWRQADVSFLWNFGVAGEK